MPPRGLRAVLAVLVTAGAGVFGYSALAAAAFAATPAAGSCGLNACAPHIDINSIDPDGTVNVTFTPEGPPIPQTVIDPNTLAATITWTPKDGIVAPGAPSPHPTSDPMVKGTCTGGMATPVTCDFSFPQDMLDNGYLLNGSYQVMATAKDCPLFVGGSNCTAGTAGPQTYQIKNKPTAPTDVKAELAQNSSAVKISWTKSPEPDVVGYQVLRADNSVACFLNVTPTPAEYACIDTPTTDGSYTYRVVAHRWAPGYSTAVKDQAASDPSGATKAVSVSGTADNTTTSVAGGTGTLGPPGFTGKVTPGKAPSAGAGPSLHLGPVSPAVVGTPTTPDPGFGATLPYGAQPAQPDPTTDSSALATPAPPAAKGKTSVGTIAVIGAGLLIGVIALHGLWLRSEVRRTPVLEVLDPEH